MKSRYLALVAAAAVVALSGCTEINSLTTTENMAINDAVRLGAEYWIQKAGGTVTAPAKYSAAMTTRAQELKSFATAVAGIGPGTVTVTQLDTLMASWVANAKTPIAEDIRSDLVKQIGAVVQIKITDGVIKAAATALVTEITTDLLKAASNYGAV